MLACTSVAGSSEHFAELADVVVVVAGPFVGSSVAVVAYLVVMAYLAVVACLAVLSSCFVPFVGYHLACCSCFCSGMAFLVHFVAFFFLGMDL